MSNFTTNNDPSAKILLIDDDPNLILLIRDYLEFRGFDVVTAESGQEGLEHLANAVPDMIICDIMMPQMDGYAFVEKVRENPKTEWIPFMFLSDSDDSNDRVKGLNQGADIYMTKPFEPEELVAQIEASLSQLKRFWISKSTNVLPVLPKLHLTPKEKKILKLSVLEWGRSDTAQELGVSQQTLKELVSKIMSAANPT